MFISTLCVEALQYSMLILVKIAFIIARKEIM